MNSTKFKIQRCRRNVPDAMWEFIIDSDSDFEILSKDAAEEAVDIVNKLIEEDQEDKISFMYRIVLEHTFSCVVKEFNV